MITNTQSLWRAAQPIPRFPALDRDLDVDVAIVGAGITGLTAAVLLSRNQLRVAVLERDRIASGESGNTTAHLTLAVDARYHRIIKDYGLDAARLVAQSSRDAIAMTESLASSTVPAAFEHTPGYLYAEKPDQVAALADELDAARQAGCDVEWVDDVPLPFPTTGAIRWDAQAQMHATGYLAALVKEAQSRGVEIFESTSIKEVHEGEPCSANTDRHRITAKHVLVAANVPVNNRVLLHTKITAYRSYAIAIEVEPGYLRGLFWDTSDPYHYSRLQEDGGRSYVIVGGEDHRTGDETNTQVHFDDLIAYTRARFPGGPVKFRWSGQIIEPIAGLPFIGPNSGASHVYVATGYSGNGLTFGTLAAMMFADHVAGKKNAYADLYDATRLTPLAGAYDYVTKNALFPAQLLKDRLTSLNADVESLDDLKPGGGGIFSGDTGKIAVFRDERDELHGVSPVCPHLGCDVAWNGAEKTWDCPCHGSRFSREGKVINGPAITDLASQPLPTPARKS